MNFLQTLKPSLSGDGDLFPCRTANRLVWLPWMRNMKKAVYILLTVLLIYLFTQINKPVSLGPGTFAPNPPNQVNIKNAGGFEFKNCTVIPLADFDIQAKVLSKYNYDTDRVAKVSPVDLALGWGRMSDEQILDSFKIRQGNRTFSWWTKELPIPRREIECSCANMHLIPADKEVKASIDKCRKGEIVKFSGYLVRVESKDGWKWQSSLTREDTRGYSCEVVFVKKFEIVMTK